MNQLTSCRFVVFPIWHHLLTMLYLTGSLCRASVVALIQPIVPNPNTSISGVQKNCLQLRGSTSLCSIQRIELSTLSTSSRRLRDCSLRICVLWSKTGSLKICSIFLLLILGGSSPGERRCWPPSTVRSICAFPKSFGLQLERSRTAPFLTPLRTWVLFLRFSSLLRTPL